MSLPDLELDLSTTHDENFREKPNNFEEMQEAIQKYKDFQEGLGDSEKDEIEKANACTMIGLYSRILLALEDSESYLKTAFELFKKHKKVSSAQMTKVRLATTYAWMDNFTKSDEYFLGSIEKFRSAKQTKSEKILTYSLEHYGKSKMERGMLMEALEFFLEAFDIKMTQGKIDEIDQLQALIGKTRGMLKEQNPDFEDEFNEI